MFTASSSGAGWYGAPEARVNVFTPWTLGGSGRVGGHEVRTIRAEVELAFHSGYPVDADDWHDVQRLAERFGQTIPPDYDRFRPGLAAVAERVVVAPGPVRPDEVELLLRLLPDWFGIEDALLSYVDDARTMPAATARDEAGHLVGVALLADHATGSPEVHLMAVHPAWRRHGVGRRVVDACAALARAQGHRLLQVKTLGPSDAHAGYARTREFYLAAGFVPVEELADLWPGTSCLLMVAPL